MVLSWSQDAQHRGVMGVGSGYLAIEMGSSCEIGYWPWWSTQPAGVEWELTCTGKPRSSPTMREYCKNVGYAHGLAIPSVYILKSKYGEQRDRVLSIAFKTLNLFVLPLRKSLKSLVPKGRYKKRRQKIGYLRVETKQDSWVSSV